jgi:hypothetical protein
MIVYKLSSFFSKFLLLVKQIKKYAIFVTSKN